MSLYPSSEICYRLLDISRGSKLTLTKVYYDSFHFKTEQQCFTYLGIQVTHAFKDLSKHNFQPLLEQSKQDLEKSASLPISLAGCIKAHSKLFLPSYWYLFSNNWINWSLFLYGIRTPHTWDLSRETEIWCMYWVSTFEENEGPSWSIMELQSSLPASPIYLLSSPLPIKPSTFIQNPIVKSSLKTWSQFRKIFDSSQTSSYSPLSSNHLFPSSIIDTAFQLWHRGGLVFFWLFWDSR